MWIKREKLMTLQANLRLAKREIERLRTTCFRYAEHLMSEQDTREALVRENEALREAFANKTRKEIAMGHYAELQAAKKRIAELEAASGGSAKAEKVLAQLVEWFNDKDKRFRDRNKKAWSSALKLVG